MLDRTSTFGICMWFHMHLIVRRKQKLSTCPEPVQFMPRDARTAIHTTEQDKPYNLYQALEDAIKDTTGLLHTTGSLTVFHLDR